MFAHRSSTSYCGVLTLPRSMPVTQSRCISRTAHRDRGPSLVAENALFLLSPSPTAVCTRNTVDKICCRAYATAAAKLSEISNVACSATSSTTNFFNAQLARLKSSQPIKDSQDYNTDKFWVRSASRLPSTAQRLACNELRTRHGRSLCCPRFLSAQPAAGQWMNCRRAAEPRLAAASACASLPRRSAHKTSPLRCPKSSPSPLLCTASGNGAPHLSPPFSRPHRCSGEVRDEPDATQPHPAILPRPRTASWSDTGPPDNVIDDPVLSMAGRGGTPAVRFIEPTGTMTQTYFGTSQEAAAMQTESQRPCHSAST